MSQISAIGPMARIRTRFMYACIQSRRLSGENCSEAESYDLLVFVDEDTKKELQYWISNTKKVNGREISTRIVELSYHCFDFFRCFVYGLRRILANTTREHAHESEYVVKKYSRFKN